MELALFDDGLRPRSRERGTRLFGERGAKTRLSDYEFVGLRPRVEGQHPLLGIREWQRLNLKIGLEVSEIIEIFMVASQLDLWPEPGPRTMESTARDLLGLKALPGSPKSAPVPIKLVWHASRDADQAHRFLRATRKNRCAGSASRLACQMSLIGTGADFGAPGNAFSPRRSRAVFSIAARNEAAQVRLAGDHEDLDDLRDFEADLQVEALPLADAG